MLILSRKIGETVKIGDDIEVTILKRSGGHIQIGIDAPELFKIYRKEFYERDKKKAQKIGKYFVVTYHTTHEKPEAEE